MGIHGLWKLLEPAGKDVTLESLENKILAIDVSLWLHQAQQGTSSGGGGSGSNAHLLTLFHRISKLLFYRIKPVFVFDGVAPELKKKTINARNQRKQLASDQAKEMRQQLLLSLAKSGAIKSVLQKNDSTKAVPGPNKTKRGNAQPELEEDLYTLPPLPVSAITPEEQYTSEDSWGSDEDDNLMSYCETEELIGKKEAGGTKGNTGGGWKKWCRWVDPHEVNVQDEGFKALPVEVRREILTDLKEARKESSWGRLHKMPKNLDSFSSFQMSRLLHRRKVQEVWEDVEKELSTTDLKGASLGELEAILAEKGVDVASGLSHINQRIASDESKGFILLKGLKNQSADNEAEEKKNTDLSLQRAIKEESADVVNVTSKPLDQMHLDKPTEEEKAEGWLGKKRERRESLTEPTPSESKILNEKDKVKNFVRVTLETSDDGADACEGGVFESIAEPWSYGDSQEGLSQREMLEMIRERPPDGNSTRGTSIEAGNEVQSAVGSKQMKGVLESESAGLEDSEMKVQEIDNKGTTQMQNIAVIRNPSEQETDEQIRNSKRDVQSTFSEIEGFIKDKEIRSKLNDAEIKEPCQVLSERYFDIESEEELSQREIMGIINDKSTNKATKSTEILYEAEIETSFRSTTSTGKGKAVDLKKESALLEEEVVIVEDKDSEELTQEEIMAIINNQPTNLIDDEIRDCKADANSETDESDFLEVENIVDEAEEKNSSNSEAKELCREDSVECLSREGKADESDKLEVVIDLDAKSDESNDIFADVFESNSPEKNIQSVPRVPSLQDQTDVDKNNADKNGCDKSIESDKVTSISEKSLEPENELEKQLREASVEERQRPLAGEIEAMTEEERQRLTLEMRKKEREATAGVTERARLESQELLGLFGVPWVVAPFEAEAQCAFLESASPIASKFASSSSIRKFLAEGTVTEDSDVWAFGASNVYRHVFDRRRTRVRVYSKEEIHKKLGLCRDQVVQLALLTGSDYTIGLPGVGTVTALEILAAFPGEKNPHAVSSSGNEVDDVLSGLQHFADWWKRVEMNEQNGTPIGHSYFDPTPAVSKTLKRRLCACWKAACLKQPGASLLPPGFPSRAVVQAYLKPSIDDCRDTFTWLKPDEAALRSYAELHFGWTKDRTDSILRPLFARLKLSDSQDRTQMTLHSYFSHIRTSSLPSDLECSGFGIRAQKALERIAGKNEELILPQRERLIKGTSDEDKETNSKQGKSGQKGRKSAIKTGNLSTLKSSYKTEGKLVKQKLSDTESLNITNASIKETGFSSSLYSSDKIPQREKECESALQSKLKAIEVLRKSSMGRGKRGARESSNRRPKKKLRRGEVPLSESSDSD